MCRCMDFFVSVSVYAKWSVRIMRIALACLMWTLVSRGDLTPGE